MLYPIKFKKQTPTQNIDDASVVEGPSAGREIETVEFTEGNTSVQLGLKLGKLQNRQSS